jgi:hypothetical protein
MEPPAWAVSKNFWYLVSPSSIGIPHSPSVLLARNIVRQPGHCRDHQNHTNQNKKTFFLFMASSSKNTKVKENELKYNFHPGKYKVEKILTYKNVSKPFFLSLPYPTF